MANAYFGVSEKTFRETVNSKMYMKYLFSHYYSSHQPKWGMLSPKKKNTHISETLMPEKEFERFLRHFRKVKESLNPDFHKEVQYIVATPYDLGNPSTLLKNIGNNAQIVYEHNSSTLFQNRSWKIWKVDN
jgi:hypothetical protein